MLLFTQYKTACLTAISNHCLAEFPAKMYCLLSTVTCSKTPTTVTWSRVLRICCHSIIDEVASKFLGVWRNFAGILPILPEKYFKKTDLQKKSSRQSGAISCQQGRCYFQIKACWAPFWFRFTGSFRRFSEILPGFYGNLPGFSPNQNFWKCGCIPCTPASYAPVVCSVG